MAQPTFFLKTVPLLDGGDDVALVLTPQAFHNLVRSFCLVSTRCYMTLNHNHKPTTLKP